MPAARLLPLQLALTAVAFAGFALAAPPNGAMLLVPVFAADRGVAVRAALAGGAMLVGAGPVAGSIVVRGDRTRLSARLGRSPILLLAAPPAGCGPLSGTTA